MNELMIKGKTNVCGIEVPRIAGGFGKDKPAMLASDIARLHGVELKQVNRNINRNRDKFVDEKDVIDLKNSVTLSHPLLKFGILSKQSIANSENIYLLSQRGYAKLLKIFDDDLAWDRYEQILDEYFELKEETRRGLQTKVTPMPLFKREQAQFLTLFDRTNDHNAKIEMARSFNAAHGLSASYLDMLKEGDFTPVPFPFTHGLETKFSKTITLPEGVICDLDTFFADVLTLVRSGNIGDDYLVAKVFRDKKMLYLWLQGTFNVWSVNYYKGTGEDNEKLFIALREYLKGQFYCEGYLKDKSMHFNRVRHRPYAINIVRATDILREIFEIQYKRQEGED